jgi:hypothetical protein
MDQRAYIRVATDLEKDGKQRKGEWKDGQADVHVSKEEVFEISSITCKHNVQY